MLLNCTFIQELYVNLQSIHVQNESGVCLELGSFNCHNQLGYESKGILLQNLNIPLGWRK